MTMIILLLLRWDWSYAEFEVDAYNDSTIALSNFKPDYYDLLLIDIQMPQINGLELSEKILKIDDKAKIWFISAYEVHYKTLIKKVSPKLKETSLDHFIQKPVDIYNLVKQVKSELDSDIHTRLLFVNLFLKI